MAPRDIKRTDNPNFFGTHCLQHLFNPNNGRSISNPFKQASQKFQGRSKKKKTRKLITSNGEICGYRCNS